MNIVMPPEIETSVSCMQNPSSSRPRSAHFFAENVRCPAGLKSI